MIKEHPEAYSSQSDFQIGAKLFRRPDYLGRPDRVAGAARSRQALVFVIACSNVANLILTRTVRREGELTIRAALGASTGALRRMLLAESLLLCSAGAALGVFSA
jgi:hypothetical protein